MNPTIKRALVSVTDKTGIVDFCRKLSIDFGVEIISTGGTAAVLRDADIKVTAIEEVTGFPEMMDGRVKTLHPKIHGALLARRDNPAHMEATTEQGIKPIDLVVVNLYAFEDTIAKEDVSEEEAIENIDIGGPSMLRSAAKNFASVTVVTNAEDYQLILDQMRASSGSVPLETRRSLATKVFSLTAAYDAAIAGYLLGDGGEDKCPSRPRPAISSQSLESSSVECSGSPTPSSVTSSRLHIHLEKIQDLRYGENPHQAATYYRYADEPAGTLAAAKQLQGKELSYNNILDTDAAWSAVREFEETSCVIVKHTNACGTASVRPSNNTAKVKVVELGSESLRRKAMSTTDGVAGCEPSSTVSNDDVVTAYQKAWEGDPISAFGGIIALNRPVSAAVVETIFANKQFVEVIIAPNFDEPALELLATKPNMRVLATGKVYPAGGRPALRSVEGGVLIQDEDAVNEDITDFKVAGTHTPTQEQMEDMLFAWKACKGIKSNAVVLAKEAQMLGMGAGQPNRVNSAWLAIEQANRKREGLDGDTGFFTAKGCVAASDAFIPFPDTVEVLAEAGVKAIIQPGGSIRDEEVIKAADELGVAMVFTGVRHFRH